MFTLSLGGNRDYYVALVQDDPPDAEVLIVDHDDRGISMIRVEMTQHGRHSESLFAVIGKKLQKRYQDGTVLLVLVEQSEKIPVAKLNDFIRRNNPHDLRIVIIGGGEKPGKFTIIPWDKVSSPAPDEEAWLEVVVDLKNASKGCRGYEGVVYKPPGRVFPHAFPTFVKEMVLRR